MNVIVLTRTTDRISVAVTQGEGTSNSISLPLNAANKLSGMIQKAIEVDSYTGSIDVTTGDVLVEESIRKKLR